MVRRDEGTSVIVSDQRANVDAPTMVVTRTRDAVGDEPVHRPGISCGEPRVVLPESQVLVSIGERHPEHRVERVLIDLAEHTHRQRNPIRNASSEGGDDRRPEALTNRQNIVDVESIEEVTQVSDVGVDAERRCLAPGRTSATKVDRHHGHVVGQTTHHQIPRTSIGETVMHQEHGAAVPLHRAATPHHDIVAVPSEASR